MKIMDIHVGKYECLVETHMPEAFVLFSVKFTVDDSMEATISGGPLNSSYILNSFHLHWGSQSNQGSEHTLDGDRY